MCPGARKGASTGSIGNHSRLTTIHTATGRPPDQVSGARVGSAL